MTAFVVITKTRPRNTRELDLYAKQAPAFMSGHPATYRARFGAREVKEGADAEGVAIIQFPTFEKAEAWYESPAYQEASQHRFKGGARGVGCTPVERLPPDYRLERPSLAA